MINVLVLLLLVVLTNGVFSIFIRLAGKDEKIPEIPTFYFNLFGGLAIFFFIGKFPSLSLVWLFPIVAAMAYALANILMFKACKKGEVSLLAPLGNLNPAIIFIFSIILLKESITIPKILGIALIIYGLSFLREQKSVISSLKAVFKDQSCQFYLLFMLMLALGRVIDKRGISYFPTTTYSFLEFAISVALLLIFLAAKRELPETLNYGKRKLGWAAGAGIVIAIKYVAYLKAISQIELSVVSPISSLGALVALALAAIFLKEKVKKRWWAAILMIAGAALLVYRI